MLRWRSANSADGPARREGGREGGIPLIPWPARPPMYVTYEGMRIHTYSKGSSRLEIMPEMPCRGTVGAIHMSYPYEISGPEPKFRRRCQDARRPRLRWVFIHMEASTLSNHDDTARAKCASLPGGLGSVCFVASDFRTSAIV